MNRIPQPSAPLPGTGAPIFAVVTPFDTRGVLDESALRDYLCWLANNGVTRIVVCGTTGEFASMASAERRRILQIARETFNGQIIAHISGCCVSDSRELLAHACDYADAALLLPPFYFADAPGEGVVEFYRQVAGDNAFPLYAYNFPRHTQFNITPDTLAKLQRAVPSLRGIKDSGGNWQQSLAYKAILPQLEVIVGSDSAAFQVLQNGLDGNVTGGANPVPRLMVDIHRHFVDANPDAAALTQARLDTWTSARKATGLQEISLVKSVLADLIPGFPRHVRPPLLEAPPLPNLVRMAQESLLN